MIPQTEQALLEKAQSIAGLTFGELADELNISRSTRFKTR